MPKRTERLQPFFLEYLEDPRLVEAVMEYATRLDPGLNLVGAEVHDDEAQPGSDGARTTRYGRDKGVSITLYEPQTGGDGGGAVEVSTFGLPEGRRARLRYEAHWDKGNRSWLELEMEGPEEALAALAEEFRVEFMVPSDTDIERLKQQMERSQRRQRWEAAGEAAHTILLWRPDDTDALLAMGTAALLSRDIDRAESLMNRLLELKPDSYQAHLNLGNVWMDRADYGKAIEHYGKVMELQPEADYAPYIVATVHEKAGDNAKALELYHKALSLPTSGGQTDYHTLAEEAIRRLGG